MWEKIEKKISVWNVLKYLFIEVWKIRYITIFAFLSIVWISILQTIIPIYFKDIVDIAVNNDLTKTEMYEQIMIIFNYFLITIFWSFIFWRIWEYLLSYAILKLDYNITYNSFSSLHKHSYDFFVNNFSGSLVKKTSRLVNSIASIYDIIFFDITRILVSIWFILIILFIENTYLWVIFWIWILLIIIFAYFLNKIRVPYVKDSANENSTVFWQYSDTVTNNFNIKLFWTYEKEKLNFFEALEKWKKKELKSIYVFIIVFAIISIIVIAWEILLLYTTIQLWYDDIISIWVFVLIVNYQIIISSQIFWLSFLMWRLANNFWDSIDMLEILWKDYEIIDKQNAKKLKINKWKIYFQWVNFSYKNQEKVLNNFELNIKAWEKIAIVWQSGSWKSTLIKILFRFYDIQEWKILIDNQDISTIKQDSLRSQISMVPQEPILFHRSLYENIAYAKDNVSYDEVIKASKMAHCHEFISKLPEWYNTLVWERWIKLSWGERQRVAIARSILSNNKIMVLDEATSSLDSESEKYIQDSLDKIMKWKTVIAIAHRLSTIMKMDRIVVMKDWKIVQEWSHEELLKKGGYYEKLWTIQSW